MCSTVWHNFCGAELLNIHPNILKHQYSHSDFNQTKKVIKGFATKKTQQDIQRTSSPPKKKFSPSFTSIFQSLKKRLSPHSSVGLPEPTSLPGQLAQNGGENPRAFETNQGTTIWKYCLSKKLKMKIHVSCLSFSPISLRRLTTFGKKRQFKPWMRLDTPSSFWNVC